jgi:cation transport ATPase
VPPYVVLFGGGIPLVVSLALNDAPALATATVGLAFGHQSEITTETAGAVPQDRQASCV